MTRARYLLLGILLALAGGAVAVTGGGFPSNPRFNNVGVGRAPLVQANQAKLLAQTPAAAGAAQIGVQNTAGTSGGGLCMSSTANVCETIIGASVLDLYSTGALQVSAPGGTALIGATAPQFGIYGTTTGALSQAYMAFRDSAGTRTGYLGMTGQGAGDVVVESDNGSVKLLAVTGQQVYASFDGGATYNPWTRQARGLIGGITTCSVTSGVNMSGCTWTATGSYTVTVSGFSGAPTCTASDGSVGAQVLTVSALATGSTTVLVKSSNGPTTFFDAASARLSLVCVGS